jgi:hypothetical protein
MVFWYVVWASCHSVSSCGGRGLLACALSSSVLRVSLLLLALDACSKRLQVALQCCHASAVAVHTTLFGMEFGSAALVSCQKKM